MGFKTLPKDVLDELDYNGETGEVFRKDGSRLSVSRDRSGYFVAGFGRKRGGGIKVHRLIWALHTGSFPDGYIDHINGIKDDNRIDNLRCVTPSQNMMNQHKAKATAPTSYIGVAKNRTSKAHPYKAQITVNKKQHFLGVFGTALEAHQAYMKAKMELHQIVPHRR